MWHFYFSLSRITNVIPVSHVFLVSDVSGVNSGVLMSGRKLFNCSPCHEWWIKRWTSNYTENDVLRRNIRLKRFWIFFLPIATDGQTDRHTITGNSGFFKTLKTPFFFIKKHKNVLKVYNHEKFKILRNVNNWVM